PMSPQPLNLGFIGLGIMGTPMAGHLLKAGHRLFVHTLHRSPPSIAESAAVKCDSARAVAERADVVFTMVPDTSDVEKALFGPGGVAAGLVKGKHARDID